MLNVSTIPATESSETPDVSDDAQSPIDTQRLIATRIGYVASGIWLCGGLLAAYTLYIGRNLFVPITVALFAYLTVRPVIRSCSRLGIPSAVSAAAVMIGLCLLIGGGGYMLSGPAQSVLEEVPRSMGDVKSKLSFIFEHLETVNEATEDISKTADEKSISTEEKPVPVEIKQPAWTTSSPIIAGTGNLVSFLSITCVLLYFLMAGGDALITNLMSTLPTFSSKKRFIEVIDSVQDGLSSYLAWVTVINACLGVAVGTAMWLLGMPSPILWGVAAMLLNYIPIVGALCGVALVFFVAIVNFDHVSQAFVVASVYGGLTALEGQFITPSLLGRSLRLCSVLVFLSIVIWGWMWGMMGVFLAVPILITLTMISEKCNAMTPLSLVMGGERDQPAVNPHG